MKSDNSALRKPCLLTFTYSAGAEASNTGQNDPSRAIQFEDWDDFRDETANWPKCPSNEIQLLNSDAKLAPQETQQQQQGHVQVQPIGSNSLDIRPLDAQVS